MLTGGCQVGNIKLSRYFEDENTRHSIDMALDFFAGSIGGEQIRNYFSM